MIVGIVGGGISGLMAAYRLIEKSSDIKVVIFEKGNDILNRINFILEDVTCFTPSKTYESAIIPDSLLTVFPKDEDRKKILTMCF